MTLTKKPGVREKRRRPFRSGLSLRSERLDVAAIRQRAQADPGTFVEGCLDVIERDGFRWEDVESLPDLWHGLRDLQVTAHAEIAGRSAPVMTGAFPLVTGALTIAGLNEAYEAVPTVGQELVTDRDSNKKRLTIAGVLSQSHDQHRVDEGQEFPLIGAGEERYDILQNRNGFRMQITAEMVEENDIPEVIARINRSGEIPAELIEEQTLKRVTDHDGSKASPSNPRVLHLDGAGVQLYRTNNNAPLGRLPDGGNRITNNALTDTTKLDEARLRMADMRNSRGRRIAIPVNRMILLHPEALASTASKLLGSEQEPGVFNELNNWGPRGRYRPIPISTPYLDDLSTSAWYLGDFRRQFVRKWKLRMELASIDGRDTENFVRRRVATEWRIAWDVEVGAQDYVYVVQNLAGTTAPADE